MRFFFYILFIVKPGPICHLIIWKYKCPRFSESWNILWFLYFQSFLTLPRLLVGPFQQRKKKKNQTSEVWEEDKSVIKYYSWEGKLSQVFEIFPNLPSLLTASQITQMASQTCLHGEHQVGRNQRRRVTRASVECRAAQPHLVGHTPRHKLHVDEPVHKRNPDTLSVMSLLTWLAKWEK